MFGSDGGSAAAIPGTPTTATPATPTTPIRILFSTDHTIRGAGMTRTTTSVLPRSAARHLLQPADPVLDRRVRREQFADLLARPERVGDHQVRLVGQLRLRRQRRLLHARADLAQRAGQRKRITRQLRAGLVGLIIPRPR